MNKVPAQQGEVPYIHEEPMMIQDKPQYFRRYDRSNEELHNSYDPIENYNKWLRKEWDNNFISYMRTMRKYNYSDFWMELEECLKYISENAITL